MRIPVLTAVFVLAAAMSARADTLRVEFMDGGGRTCSAEIVIDDATHHPISVSGVDYEGREYSYTLQAFTATEFDACSSRMRMYGRDGYWYDVSPSEEGVLCGIGRYGGPGYSSALFVYRFIEPSSDDNGSTRSRPNHE
jgi:hypothetical protein